MLGIGYSILILEQKWPVLRCCQSESLDLYKFLPAKDLAQILQNADEDHDS